MKRSDRASGLTQSAIRAMTVECNRLDGINMAQGVCDLEIPDVITQGAKAAIDNGFNTYMACEGYPDLRKAVADKMNRFYGMTVDPETEVFISAGATGVFYSVCMALLNPGDEVLLLEPFYGYHTATLKALGCKPVFAALEPPEWTINPDALEAAVSPATRALVLNTPGNPSGKVFSYAELTQIAAFAESHDLIIISDEIYEHFVYDGRKHIPPATIPGLRDRTVTVSGFSKIFSITGWRLGYGICPADICEAAAHMNDLVYVCGPSPLQVGASEGLINLDADYYETVEKEHQWKRDTFCKALSYAGLEPYIPQGAYYTLADISMIPGDGDFGKVMNILQKTGVAAVPGNAFYHHGKDTNLARFCFAKKKGVLMDACNRISKLKS